MNVPVTYWPLYAAARFDLAATLTDFLLSNTSQLAANPEGVPDAFGMGGTSSYDLIGTYSVTPGAMLGNFPWICHNLYLHAAMSGNASLMRGAVFPLLRGAVNVYKHFAFEGRDGLIHLPASYSPEYPYPPGGPTSAWCI
jgi:alpha-L-fucosidase 2